LTLAVDPVEPTVLLETARLRLRAFTHSDLDALGALYADPTVTRFVCPPLDRLAAFRVAARALAFCAERSDPTQPGIWAIEHAGVLVGRVGLSRWRDHDHPVFELGFLLATRWTGRGLATEAASALQNHAFATLGLRRLVALVHPNNTASQTVLRKLGFVQEAGRTEREHNQPREVWHAHARG
jgi:RimJ/RimL family protein N-acetyltransferase